MDNVVVGILILICVVAGIWGWWLENGPVNKENSKNEALSEETIEENNSSQTDKTSD